MLNIKKIKESYKSLDKGAFVEKWRSFKRVCLLPYRFAQNVWWFRRELWAFRGWDYGFNLALLARSIERSRNFHLSEKASAEDSIETAAEMTRFLELLKDFDQPWEAAEKLKGQDPLWKKSQDIEKQSWEDAMNLLKEKMPGWWD